MKINKILQKMIDYSQGNLHDINHLIKVYTYATTIGEAEILDENTMSILQAAAITHDIACPLCREKYGNTNGSYQEKEGIVLVKNFLKDCEITDDEINRIAYLVGHHHTLTNIDGADYQILIEADYIVNADESSYSTEKIRNVRDKIFKTKTGISLLNSIYGLN